MKTMKKLCAVLLSLMLVFGLFSMSISAAEPENDILSASVENDYYVVNEEIVLTALTDDDVTDVAIMNESGRWMGRYGVLYEDNGDGTKTWTVKFTVGTAGNNRVISVYSRTATTSFADSGITVSMSITKTPIVNKDFDGKALSVSNPDYAKVNTPFSITVTTTENVENIRIINENNKVVIPVSTEASVAGGVKTWNVSLSVGTCGDNRAFTVYAVNPYNNGVAGAGIAMNMAIGLEEPEEPPVVEPAYQNLDENLTLTWTPANDTAGSAQGVLQLTSAVKDSKGAYKVYYADNKGVIEGYAEVASLTLTNTSLTKSYDKFIKENVIPVGATRFAAVKDNVIKAYVDIPKEKQFNPGELKYKQAVLSDVHVFNDTSNVINGYDELPLVFPLLNEWGADFVSVTGDFILNGDNEANYNGDLNMLLPILEKADIQINPVKGNHDKGIDEDLWESIFGTPVDFSFTHNGETFIYVSLKTVNSTGSNDLSPYGEEKLEWLEQEMAKAAGGRIYLFMHYPLTGYAGLTPGQVYGYTSESTEDDRVLDLIKQYGNTYIFGGHTHFDFKTQETYPDMMIKQIEGTNSYTVHVPSLAYPRTSDGTQITYESLGYFVEVYEDGIVLNGFDMKEDNKIIPIGTYYLESKVNPYYLSDSSIEMYTGRSNSVEIMGGEYENAVWSSSNRDVVTVDNYGELTAVAPGTATISITVDGYELKLNVTVSDPTPISIPTAISLGIGESGAIDLSGSYTTVTYSSDNEGVVTVDAKGTVKAVAAGSANITAKVDGVDYTVAVTVVDAPATYTGSGTLADPYIISTATQFVSMQQKMLSGETFAGKYFLQTADLVLNYCPNYKPMADAGSTMFSGTYNGNGYELKVTVPTLSDSFAPPFFWYINGTIVNTGFNVDIKGCSSTSYGIARELRTSAKMMNCYLVGDMISNTNTTTLIAGTSSGTNTIDNMYAYVNVSGTTPGSSSGVSIKGNDNTVNHYYYVDCGCVTRYAGEIEVTVDGLATLAPTLSSNAEKLNISGIDFCSWETENGVPVMLHDGGYAE